MSEFREMRRKRQQLSNEESIALLEKATAGTLALLGDGDYPYGDCGTARYYVHRSSL